MDVKKDIKKEENVTKEINPIDTFNRKGFYIWHKYVKYSLNNSSIIITDSIGGCGIQHLYGWRSTNYNSENMFAIIKEVINDLHAGVGLITCQIGAGYINSKLVQALEENNFTYIEYKNYQHNPQGKEIGRLYTLIINKNAKN